MHYNPKQENMLKDMDFCHLLEIHLRNMEKNYWILEYF